MEETLVAFSIQVRRDTSANWNSVNPTLLSGEPGLETDTGKLKIGDGNSAWSTLPYLVPAMPAAVPAGSVMPFAGAVAPSGWLMCNGSAISRTEYAALFSAIGTTYGVGDNSTTFNLPNLTGRVPVGFDATQTEFDSLGEVGGAKTHTLNTSEMPSHTHTQNAHSHGGTAASNGAHTHTASTGTAGDHTHTGSSDTAGAHDHGDISSSGSHTHPYEVGGIVTRSTGTSNTMGILLTVAATTSATSHTHPIASGGSHSHSLTINSAGGHNHTVTVDSAGAHTHVVSTDAQIATNQNTGGGLAHNNLQPYIVLNYMIKT